MVYCEQKRYLVSFRFSKVFQKLLSVKRRQMMTLKYRETHSCAVSQNISESASRTEVQLIP
jgi:hypothetical protein